MRPLVVKFRAKHQYHRKAKWRKWCRSKQREN